MNVKMVTNSTLHEYENALKNSKALPIVVPIFRYANVHPAINTLAAVFVYIDGTVFEFGMGHPDILLCQTVPTFDVAISVNLKNAMYAKLEAKTWYDWSYRSHEDYAPQFFRLPHLPEDKKQDLYILPISMIRKAVQFVFQNMKIEEPQSFLEASVIPTLFNIEREGMYVSDVTQFSNRHTNESIVYGGFNPYNLTGRVTNSFAGRNFSALNKTDGSRDLFISRFANRGRLVEIDFESFHLHLMARLIGYTIPDEPFHLHLAKQYFGTDDITDELYQEGKKNTFKVMYSGTYSDFTDIPFFGEVDRYLQDIASGIKTFPVTEIPLRINTDLELPKQLSYVMQNLEAVETLKMLENIVKLLKNYKSKVTMYTYDSFVIDMSHEDPEILLTEIANYLTFPYSIKTGENYGNMQK